MVIRKVDAMDEQLTLKDGEKLYNMLRQSEQLVQDGQEEIRQLAIRTANLEAFKDKELHEQITQLEMRLRKSEARIPKTGLLSHSMLTRIVTVCGYLFIAQIAWFLVGGFVLIMLNNYWLKIVLGFAIVIIILATVVHLSKKTDADYNDALQWTTRKV